MKLTFGGKKGSKGCGDDDGTLLEVKKEAWVVEMMMEHFWRQKGRCDGRLLTLLEVATLFLLKTRKMERKRKGVETYNFYKVLF